MKETIKLFIIFSLIMVCSFYSYNNKISANSTNNNSEIVSLKLNNETYNYEIINNGDDVNVIIKDANENIISTLFVINNVVYEMEEGKLSIIAYINDMPVEVAYDISPYIEANWGSLLSNRTRVTIPNSESVAVSSIAGILISAITPKFVSITVSVVIAVAEYYNSKNPRYIDQTLYYHEAIGCPQYRWLKKYEARNPNGTVIKSSALSSKEFHGITHSPQNPPACTVYGF